MELWQTATISFSVVHVFGVLVMCARHNAMFKADHPDVKTPDAAMNAALTFFLITTGGLGLAVIGVAQWLGLSRIDANPATGAVIGLFIGALTALAAMLCYGRVVTSRHEHLTNNTRRR